MAKKYDLNGNVVEDDSSTPAAPVENTTQRYDLNGNPIAGQKVANAATSVMKTISGAPEKSLAEGGQWSDLIPALATIGAGFIPGGAGMRMIAPAIGAGSGELLRSAIQKGPSNVGLEDLSNATNSAALAGGLGVATEGLTSGVSKLSNVVKKQQLNKALKANEILNDVRGQVTGYKAPNVTSSTVDDVLGEKIAPIRAVENPAWDRVRTNANNNVETFQVQTGTQPSKVVGPNGQPIQTPIIENRDIAGPVNIDNNIKPFLNGTGKQILDIYPTLPQDAQSKLFKIYDTLKKIQNGAITDVNGKSYIPFELAKELRTNIGEITSAEKLLNLNDSTRSVGMTRQGAALTNLRDAVTKDIEDSLPQWKNSGPQALQDFGKAVGITKQRVKAGVFDKAVAENTNARTGRLNIDGFLNDVMGETSELKDSFTAPERAGIAKAMNAIAAVSPDFGGSFTYDNKAFILRNAMRIGSNPTGLGIAVAARDAAEKLFLEPKYARIISQMPSLPPNSAQASMMRKTILGALKGTAVYIITPSGQQIPGRIDENGNPVVEIGH